MYQEPPRPVSENRCPECGAPVPGGDAAACGVCESCWDSILLLCYGVADDGAILSDDRPE